eukprot:scaffold19621_cov63-Cyclotella_meneghiniana.AAC.3
MRTPPGKSSQRTTRWIATWDMAFIMQLCGRLGAAELLYLKYITTKERGSLIFLIELRKVNVEMEADSGVFEEV